MNFESHSDKTDKHDGNTLAQNVISNLTEAVNASVENLSEIAGTDKVDGIDIVLKKFSRLKSVLILRVLEKLISR